MSKQLEAIEKAAYSGVISKPQDIDDILRSFLGKKYVELAPIIKPSKGTYSYMVKDLAAGYDIDVNALRECSVREILQLVGFCPGIPWFDFRNTEKWPFELREDNSRMKTTNQYVSLCETAFFDRATDYTCYRFCNISVESLFQHLRNKCMQTASYDIASAITSKKNSIHVSLGRYYHIAMNERTTIRDIVGKEIIQSTQPWFWFAQDIDTYMRNIIYTANATAEILSAVKIVYEPNDKTKLKAVLNKCNFECDFEQIDTESCIEY